MVRTTLPTVPAIILGVIEPALLIWATVVVNLNPRSFFVDQAPSHPMSIVAVPPQGVGAALQLGNCCLLAAFMALYSVWTPHPEISRRYLMAMGLADLGHIYSFYRAVGADYFFNFGGWHEHMWQNVGVTAFLHVVRLATLAGVFGRIGVVPMGKDKSG